MAALDRIVAIEANNAKVYLNTGARCSCAKAISSRPPPASIAPSQLNPGSIDAYILRCATLIDLGRLEAAMLDAEHLVRVAGNDARSYNMRGLVRLQQGQLEQAPWRTSTGRSRSTRRLGYVYENRALAHKAMGNRELALADLSPRPLGQSQERAGADHSAAQIYIADGELDGPSPSSSRPWPSTRTSSRRSWACSRRWSPSRCRRSTSRAG